MYRKTDKPNQNQLKMKWKEFFKLLFELIKSFFVRERIAKPLKDEEPEKPTPKEIDEKLTFDLDERDVNHIPPKQKIKLKRNRYHWVFMNAHGKKQAGKRSPKFSNGIRFYEWEWSAYIVKRVAQRATKAGISFSTPLLEFAETIGKDLKFRATKSNQVDADLPKITVPIHSNAYGAGWNTNAKGIETWHKEHSTEGKKIASVFQHFLVKKLGWKDRGLKTHQLHKDFYVFDEIDNVVSLLEIGFYTNPVEVRKLMLDAVKDSIADAIIEAVLYIEKNGLTLMKEYE